ncbi:MAG: hypothetical protein ACR2RV_25005 [Verrucomicrobiales bacterium]
MQPDEQEQHRIEQRLRELSPAEPGEDLATRIFSAFELPADAAPARLTEPAASAPSTIAWTQPFAAAAAVALIAGVIAIIGFNRQSGDSDQGIADVPGGIVVDNSVPVSFVPAHAQNTYRGSQLEDIIFTEDRRPVQIVRHQFTDSYTWVNPVDGSQVEIRFPVERIRYIPVQTD